MIFFLNCELSASSGFDFKGMLSYKSQVALFKLTIFGEPKIVKPKSGQNKTCLMLYNISSLHLKNYFYSNNANAYTEFSK